jgi:hypothetical protein
VLYRPIPSPGCLLCWCLAASDFCSRNFAPRANFPLPWPPRLDTPIRPPSWLLHYCENDQRLLLEHIFAQQWHWITLVQQLHTWLGVKNTFGMSVHSKENTFQSCYILLLVVAFVRMVSIILFERTYYLSRPIVFSTPNLWKTSSKCLTVAMFWIGDLYPSFHTEYVCMYVCCGLSPYRVSHSSLQRFISYRFRSDLY